MRAPSKSLAALIDLRPGEGLALALLFGHAICKGLSTVFLETSANTRFLAEHGVALLPWVYVVIAPVALLMGLLYTRLERSLAPMTLIKGMVLLAVLGSLLFYALTLWGSKAATAFPMMVWRDLHAILLELEFWALAGFVFNLRQGKRLFGPVTAGAILGYIVGGFATPPVVQYVGPDHLILLSALSGIACFIFLLVTIHLLSDKMDSGGSDKVSASDEDRPVETMGSLIKRPYVLLIFSLSLCSLMAIYLLDYLFYQQVEGRFPDEAELAVFFGLFAAALGLASLATSALVTGRFLSRFGLRAALMLMPIIGLVGLLLTNLLLQMETWLFLVFWVLVATKLASTVLNEAVQEPCFRILYQPLPRRERLRVQTLNELIVEPLAAGCAGLLLIFVIAGMSLGTTALSGMFALFALVVIITSLVIRREYLRALTQALQARCLEGEAINLTDPASRQVLRRSLQSNQPMDVVNALRLLEESEHPDIVDYLLAALKSEEKSPQIYALERLERLAPSRAEKALTRYLQYQDDPILKGKALCALAALEVGAGIGAAYAALGAQEEVLSDAGLLALARHGGLEGLSRANESFQAMMHHDDPLQRRRAAILLGDSGVGSFYQPLLVLLRDPVAEVRLAAVEASGFLQHERLIVPLIESLTEVATRSAAMTALGRFGETALPSIVAAMGRECEDQECLRLLRLASRIDSRASKELLLASIDGPRRALREASLRHLAARGERPDKVLADRLTILLRTEVSDCLATLQARLALEDDPLLSSLCQALAQEAERSRDRVAQILCLLLPSHTMRQAASLSVCDEVDLRARGLEILDNLLPTELRFILLPFFDEISDREILQRLSKLASSQHGNRDEILQWILAGQQHGAWTQALAAAFAGELKINSLQPNLMNLLNSPSSLLRESAAWALHCLGESESLMEAMERQGQNPRVEDGEDSFHWSDAAKETVAVLNRAWREGALSSDSLDLVTAQRA